MAGPDMKKGRLIAPVGRPVELPLGFYFVCPEDALERPAIRAFRDWLVAEIAAYRSEITPLCAKHPRQRTPG